MVAETSRDSSNIPDTGSTVKSLLEDALAGAPVRVHDLALSVSRDATVGEALDVLARLVEADKHMVVRSRFCQGDLFRQMELRGSDKRAFIAGVKAAHGANFYNALRRYAWVAGKWPADRRSDKKCWAYYVNNEPGRPGEPKRELPPIEMTFVSEETIGGEVVLLWEMPSGRLCVGRKKIAE